MGFIKISIFAAIVFVLGITFADAGTCVSCDTSYSSCTLSCDNDYGPDSPNRGDFISPELEIQCSGSEDAALEEASSCYLPNAEQFDSCIQNCGDDSACSSSCVDSYNSQLIVCGDGYLNTCYERCTTQCGEQLTSCNVADCNLTSTNSSIGDSNVTVGDANSTVKNLTTFSECSVTVTSNFEGVSADGVSSIEFKLVLEGDYEGFDFYLVALTGELKGKIIRPNPTTILFTPDSADDPNIYLTPQNAAAVSYCIPKGGSDEDKSVATIPFTVEQPPLFFVHGFMSSAHPTWDKFQQRAAADGWQYDDIDYPGDGDIATSGTQLGTEIGEFITRINHGEYYGGKTISATKVDIIAHSMGGLVTRSYIGSGAYGNNIRKFVMLGTPNHGAWDATRYAVPIGMGGLAAQQLQPGSPFLVALNSQSLNSEVEYHIVAGTGWSTDQKKFLNTTCDGDGLVTLESAELSSVPLYCTYDAHTGFVYWAAPICWSAFRNNGGGWFTSDGGTLPTSDATYGITTSAILTGTASGAAPCGVSGDASAEGIKATVKSPVTLHAYDSEGNHIGPDDSGYLENQLGTSAYYSNISEAGHQSITVIGTQDVVFVIKGEENGEFGFDMVKWDSDGTDSEFSLENVSVEQGVAYYINGSSDSPVLQLAPDAFGAQTASSGASDAAKDAAVCFPSGFAALLLSAVLVLKSREG